MKLILAVAVSCLALFVLTGASAAKRPPHAAVSSGVTLTATPNVVHAGDVFDVTGCGFDTSLDYSNVIVGFVAGGWGGPLDQNGCITIPGIPAMSGDTLAAGEYPVRAYQLVNGSWTVVATTTVTVIE